MSLPRKTIPLLSQLSVAQTIRVMGEGNGNYNPTFLYSFIFGGNGVYLFAGSYSVISVARAWA